MPAFHFYCLSHFPLIYTSSFLSLLYESPISVKLIGLKILSPGAACAGKSTWADLRIVSRNEDPEKLKSRITAYWAGQKDAWLAQRLAELHSPLGGAWRREFETALPSGRPLRILDVGTGCGFFSIILSQMGHSCTGIDITPEMIEGAKTLAGHEKAPADFLVMDAENLDFPDESFDAVVSRNLTWTLPHPARGYSEWLRVLKKGGTILNFDADYGKEDLVAELDPLPKEHSHNMLDVAQLEECDAIKARLSISGADRPNWDLQVLLRLGCTLVSADMGANERINPKEGPFHNPMTVFNCG